jgi:mannosyltransferase OCH1-like enzyme
MIPRLLCQTWRSATLPEAARRLQAGWRSRNPEFTYRFYDDAACRAVVAAAFPDYLADYDRLPVPVMRADVFRYAVIFRDGGLYADVDMECLKPIGPVLKGGSCIFSVEAHLGRTRQRELGYARGLQVANCIFAAEPRHPLLGAAVARSIELFRAHDSGQPIPVEDITGPRMLTRLISERAWPGLMLLPQIVLMAPLDYPDIWPINRHMHARHRTFGSWKAPGARPSSWRRFVERNRWPNPLPFGFSSPIWGRETDP